MATPLQIVQGLYAGYNGDYFVKEELDAWLFDMADGAIPNVQISGLRQKVEEINAERSIRDVLNLQADLGDNEQIAIAFNQMRICCERAGFIEVRAAITETEQPKWWERSGGPNMIDIHSTQEFLSALSQAGDKLVIVEFYATWCASCRALFPKLCKTSEEHPEILFLKVNFDENKPMCKNLNVKVLPFFHFYRGADGLLEAFSCSLAKFQKIKDAIAAHNTDRCSIGPPIGVGDLNLEALNNQSLLQHNINV